MRLTSKFLVLFVATSIAVNAHAFWALLAPVGTAIMWLGRAASSNVTTARAIEWSIYAHGAAIGFLTWKGADDTAPQTSAPISARLVVQPNPSAKRDNPDPNKWDDATTTRDPTPKSSYPVPTGLPLLPSSWPAVVQDIGGVGSKSYYQGNYRRDIIVTATQITDRAKAFAAYVTVNGVSSYYYVYDTATLLSCPSGYTLSSGNCILQNVAQVQKPAGKVPCEVIRNFDGTWEVDTKNPECAGLGSQLTSSGNTLSYEKGDGTQDSIQSNDDGTTTIRTGSRTIQLGPKNADGDYPINSITDSGNGDTGSGSPGSGGTGSGSGNCGGAGQTPCAVSVDDSGFDGKGTLVNTAADAAIGKLDERQAFIEGKANDNSNFGLDNAWIPSLLPGPAVTCSALKWEPGISHGPLAGLSASIDIDWCSKIDVLREYYAWLIGLVTVWAIAMLFFGSNGNTGRSGK